MQPLAALPWLALGVLLAVFAAKVRTAIVGGLLVLGGLAVFAVRLHHAGSYPFPGPADLTIAVATLLAGALLIRSPWSGPREGGVSPVTRVLLGLSPILLVAALVAFGHEAEEVVVLRTLGPEGQLHQTRLWIVDTQGSPWVVTSRGSVHDRDLTQDPRVEIVRRGETRCFLAERHVDRATIERLLEVRSQKYRAQRIALASGLWRHFSKWPDLDRVAVAIRFVPCPD